MAYSFLDLAEEVLKDASKPLTVSEIWARSVESNLDKKVNTKGITPSASLGARLSTEFIHRSDKTRFARAGTKPQQYFLKSRQHEIKGVNESNEKPMVKETTYLEKDLHPLLAYLVATNPRLFGEQVVYTKTIRHEKSKGKTLKEWLHPDMVGVYFPFDDLEKSVIKLGQFLNSDSVQVFSFELKRSITRSNYREYFFQAVSNSSWAHQGYLVASEISEDDDLRRELERLTNAFGIGIIHLNVNDIDSSRVLFDAKPTALDWETINKLCSVNKDFASFVERLNTDISVSLVHKSEYDEIIEDPVKHIREKLKIKTAE